MKRFKILFITVCVMGILAGCGTKVECDFCGEVKKCTTKTVWGEEINYCKDCAEEITSMFD